MITIKIPGEPQGKKRPRMTKAGTVYTASETVKYEKFVKACWKAQAKGKMFHGCVRVAITAFYGIPKTVSKAARLAMLDCTRRPDKKPDIDNVVKIILDGLNKAAYDDDKQVVSVDAKKYYGAEPHVIVTVSEV